MTKDERIAQLEGQVASLRIDLAFMDEEFATTKAAHVRDIDELVELRRECERLRNALVRSTNCLGHLEYGIKEYRRIEQNMQMNAIDDRLRRESA